MRCHLLSQELPPASFYEVEKGIYVASPQLCFTQITSRLSPVEAALAAFELCGTYTFERTSDEGARLVEAPALCTASDLRRFLEEVGSIVGAVPARKAAAQVLDGAASPMEAKLALLLTAPVQGGGYGLERPALNKELMVPARLKRDAGKSTFRCDMLWEGCRLAVEYDSDSVHLGSRNAARDSRRRNALMLMGLKCVTVTTMQMEDYFELERIARAVAVETGKRVRHPNERTRQKQIVFHGEVLGAHHEMRLLP